MSDETPKPFRPIKPPPLPKPVTPSPNTVLDSIFRQDGPMPTASIGLRTLAFFLDCFLVSAVASIIIWKIALPQSHPGAFAELASWSKEYVSWYVESSQRPVEGTENLHIPLSIFIALFFDRLPIDGPKITTNLQSILSISSETRLLIFWLYFAASEAFFKGTSLGKRICRIRTISTITLSTPAIATGIIRGGLKTLTLYLFFPLAMIATLLALFFNKRRQMGHDLFSRTAVVDEKYVNLKQLD